jgi:hypothetical protein
MNKYYFIPTKAWVNNFNELDLTLCLNKDRINFNKIIMTKNILIKMTLGRNHNLVKINTFVKKLPNMVYSYYVIICSDYLPILLKNIKMESLKNRICSSTFEIMKFYKNGSISKLINIDIKKFKLILHQLVLAQTNLFMKCGLTHCNINENNILIHKHKKYIDLKYLFLLEPQIIKTKYEFIISDYDDCFSFFPCDNIINNIVYNNKIFSRKKILSFTLLTNIMITIKVLIDKLNINDNIKINKIYKDYKKEVDNYLNVNSKLLNNYLDDLKKIEIYNENQNKIKLYDNYINVVYNNVMNYYYGFVKLF